MPELVAISDSANFYVSAERCFDMSLRNVPVIVLSNNDGCAVARSDEAKALGIKMGEPLFKLKDKIRRHGIRVLSSNYTLYGDMSRRVADVYDDFTPHVEVYSIDECFLDFSGTQKPEHHARCLREEVRLRTGIPVRVGIATTKTLSKCANDLAKRNPIFNGVLDMSDPRLVNYLLPKVDVGDIWGIGSQTKKKLNALSVYTAEDFRNLPAKQLRAIGTVTLERIHAELHGYPCIEFQEIEPQRKGMAVTRSSGQLMVNFDMVFEALTAHATRAAEKLRKHGLVAGTLTAFFKTNSYNARARQHRASRTTKLTPMSNDTFDLLAATKRCAESGWKGLKDGNGYAYSKAGIILDDLLPIEDKPQTLFTNSKTRSPALMQALDSVNDRFGKKTMVMASEGFNRSTQMKNNYRSPKFTTRISDLPVLK